MTILDNGAIKFDDVFELIYELLNELELEIQPNGYIKDNTINGLYSFNGMMVKASTNPNHINYAGQGEIEFDILNNVRLMTMIFGKYLEKKQQEGMSFVAFFHEEQDVESTKRDEEDYKISRLTVKFDSFNSVTTPYYRNKCLKYIDMIFRLEETPVFLENFDVPDMINPFI